MSTATKPQKTSSKGSTKRVGLFSRPRDQSVTLNRTWNREVTWADVLAIWIAYLVTVSIPPVQATWLYMQINGREVLNSQAAKFLGLSKFAGDASSFSLDENEPMKDGEVVAGFTVTSPRGRRDIGDGPEFHEGVDLATPVATPLMAPAAVDVKCRTAAETGGGGVVAEFSYGGFTHQFLHLNQCFEGLTPQGEAFGLTGNTGRSTGPHLDYRMRKGNRYKEPSRSLLSSVLTGRALSAGSGGFVERYKAAISAQESGDDYSVLNRSGSSAMGRYQFMPDTALHYAGLCGIEYPGDEAFLSSQETQEQLMDCYVGEHMKAIKADSDLMKVASTEKGLCRLLASSHYSGDFSLYDNPDRQYWGDDEYPSIQEYTLSVCEDF